MTLSNDKESRKELRKFLKGTAKSDHRQRDVGINIRVSPAEKRHITLLAHSVGLSVSETLRQLANGQKITAIPPEAYYQVRCELKAIEDILVENIVSGCAVSEDVEMVRYCIEEFKRIAEKFYGDSFEAACESYEVKDYLTEDYGYNENLGNS